MQFPQFLAASANADFRQRSIKERSSVPAADGTAMRGCSMRVFVLRSRSHDKLSRPRTFPCQMHPAVCIAVSESRSRIRNGISCWSSCSAASRAYARGQICTVKFFQALVVGLFLLLLQDKLDLTRVHSSIHRGGNEKRPVTFVSLNSSLTNFSARKSKSSLPARLRPRSTR